LFAERRVVDLFNAVDVEGADREIDRFIERRHQETNGEQRHIEVLWKESTRRERDKRRRENAEAWYGHHEHMRELHSSPPPPITRQVGRRIIAGGRGWV
jgi:hypothetical protein